MDQLMPKSPDVRREVPAGINSYRGAIQPQPQPQQGSQVDVI